MEQQRIDSLLKTLKDAQDDLMTCGVYVPVGDPVYRDRNGGYAFKAEFKPDSREVQEFLNFQHVNRSTRFPGWIDRLDETWGGEKFPYK